MGNIYGASGIFGMALGFIHTLYPGTVLVFLPGTFAYVHASILTIDNINNNNNNNGAMSTALLYHRHHRHHHPLNHGYVCWGNGSSTTVLLKLPEMLLVV